MAGLTEGVVVAKRRAFSRLAFGAENPSQGGLSPAAKQEPGPFSQKGLTHHRRVLCEKKPREPTVTALRALGPA